MARMADVVWQADASGNVTSITPCRPLLQNTGGQLDETEIRQLEQLWRKSAKVVERFSATYHIRKPGSPQPRHAA